MRRIKRKQYNKSTKQTRLYLKVYNQGMAMKQKALIMIKSLEKDAVLFSEPITSLKASVATIEDVVNISDRNEQMTITMGACSDIVGVIQDLTEQYEANANRIKEQQGDSK